MRHTHSVYLRQDVFGQICADVGEHHGVNRPETEVGPGRVNDWISVHVIVNAGQSLNFIHGESPRN